MTVLYTNWPGERRASGYVTILFIIALDCCKHYAGFIP